MSIHLLNESTFSEEAITEEDVDKSKIAAAEGDAEAQYHLALMFDTGRGVVRNPREAEIWYKKAAEQGHANAQYFLARMYSIETSGVNKNEAEAKRWFQAAANQGHAAALEKVSN